MIEFLTAILVIITGFYALATFRILKANEKVVSIMHEQAEALVRPYIYISTILAPKAGFIYLRISNKGKTAAKNLRLEIDKDFYKFGKQQKDKNLAELTAFREPIDCFPPGAELIFYLAQGFVIFGENSDPDITPQIFHIKATYSYDRKTVEETTTIDLRPYYRSNFEPAPLLDKLDKINESIQKIASYQKTETK